MRTGLWNATVEHWQQFNGAAKAAACRVPPLMRRYGRPVHHTAAASSGRNAMADAILEEDGPSCSGQPDLAARKHGYHDLGLFEWDRSYFYTNFEASSNRLCFRVFRAAARHFRETLWMGFRLILPLLA